MKTKKITDLEALSGLKVPKDYANFLLKLEDSNLEDRFFRSRDSADENWELEEYLLLETSDATVNISYQWDPTKLFDLHDFQHRLVDYLCIGRVSGGSMLMLNCKSGAINLLAHDFEAPPPALKVGEGCSILFVASSFADFRKSLLSEDEVSDEDDFGQDWHDMAELRRSQNEKLRLEYEIRKQNKLEHRGS